MATGRRTDASSCRCILMLSTNVQAFQQYCASCILFWHLKCSSNEKAMQRADLAADVSSLRQVRCEWSLQASGLGRHLILTLLHLRPEDNHFLSTGQSLRMLLKYLCLIFPLPWSRKSLTSGSLGSAGRVPSGEALWTLHRVVSKFLLTLGSRMLHGHSGFWPHNSAHLEFSTLEWIVEHLSEGETTSAIPLNIFQLCDQSRELFLVGTSKWFLRHSALCSHCRALETKDGKCGWCNVCRLLLLPASGRVLLWFSDVYGRAHSRDINGERRIYPTEQTSVLSAEQVFRLPDTNLAAQTRVKTALHFMIAWEHQNYFIIKNSMETGFSLHQSYCLLCNNLGYI